MNDDLKGWLLTAALIVILILQYMLASSMR
jgi:hypothetical protein